MGATTKTYVAVVDDDESLCRSLSRLLRTAECVPITYTSAEAFMEDHKRPRFDCIVMDLQLQGISGSDLGRQLALSNDRTPIVYITANDDPEEQAAAEAGGCAGYFHKTDEGTKIVAAIRRISQQTDAHASMPS